MSRWLKSVNNLLETLDGKAETVADSQAIGKLLENGRDVVTSGLLTATARSDKDSSSTSDNDNDGEEEDEDDDDGSDNFSHDEENGTTEEAVEEEEENDHQKDINDEELWNQDPKTQQNSEIELALREMASDSHEDATNNPLRRKRHDRQDDATVSDISFSEGTEEDNPDDEPLSRKPTTTTENDAIADSVATATTSTDAPPKTPNRYASHPGQVEDMATSTSLHEQSQGPPTTKTPKTSNKIAAGSPKIDESPRHPRRSIEASPELPAAGLNLLEEEVADEETSTERIAMVEDAAVEAPPRLPNRYPSFPANQAPSTAVSSKGNKTVPTPAPTPVPPPPPVSSSSNNKQISKATKDYQKLKDKMQILQAQLSKATTELKTTQSLNQSLKTQNQTLESKLEAANAEIQAQNDELRRAGERMEKDRLRAQEEREDLLDEQDEELAQLKQTHQKEMDIMRNQYESQISDLTNQLHAEETRRRQEGGDYTQELQDAIERERDALKQLNAVTLEKTQLQTQVSKLESQHTSLQGKLESSLQSVKTAAEREREAEDKLDAAMSLYARQMTQRQAREAELEKTIFELGTALTRMRQKQIVGATAKDATSENEEESLKDKYSAAAEEVETLKVQLHLETQRREALQEELNDISKERAEEASSAQARQRLHDRKVSELESAIGRLQAIVREQKSVLGKNSDTVAVDGKDSSVHSVELQDAQREIESLSTKLLRHQNMAEISKSEILALKGRLQAAISRAEQAEQSLQVAQSLQSTTSMSNSRLYEMEAGGVRRRIKGGAVRSRTRTIRSALQITPGRTNHPFMEHVAETLDALDHWMVDTGAFLRHEPLARLAFMLYLMILHLWSFALVVFHATEQPHADFGSMDNNPRHWRAAAVSIQQK